MMISGGQSCDLCIRGQLALAGDAPVSGLLAIRDGTVLWRGPVADAPELAATRQVVLAPGAVVVPGFVDLHVHGAGGADAVDGDVTALQTIAATHARHGTTALCPTVLTAPVNATLRALEAIRAASGDRAPDGARILGANLEGPFLNPERAGAQPVDHLRRPDLALLDELLAAAGGTLRVVTLAPELPGALQLIERLVEHGVVAAIGHSAASYDEAQAGVAAGCRLVTHLFNAMPPLHHREPGLVGAALASARLNVEVIADGVHLAGPVLQLVWRLKGQAGESGSTGLVLVTDCTAALESQGNGSRLGAQAVVVERGAARLADGTLAGSTLTMDRALSNLVTLAGAPLGAAVRAATAAPAALLAAAGAGVDTPLAPGAPADLVVIERAKWASGSRVPSLWRARATVVSGRLVAGALEG